MANTPKSCFVYELKCKCGERYVGLTTDVRSRQQSHRCRLTRCTFPLYRHLRDCGMEKKDIHLNVLAEFDDVDIGHLDERNRIRGGYTLLNGVRYYEKDTRWRRWYLKNIERRKAYKNRRVNCEECGKEMNFSSLKRHMDSCH